MVLTLLGMIFFNLVSAITTEYAVYVLARRGGLEVAGGVDWSVYMKDWIAGKRRPH